MDNKTKIAVLTPPFSKNEILRKELSKHFKNVKHNLEGKNLMTQEEIIDFTGDSNGVIMGLESFNKKVISKLPNLKIISKFGVGLDNVDLEYCKSRNIKLSYAPGVNKLSVAEQTLGFMIGLCRNLFFTSFKLKNGVWDKRGGVQLSEKTIGIIGVGNAGREVIRLLKPFNCKILVNDIRPQKEYYKKNNLTESSKEGIYRKSDIVSIHVPLTSKTNHMINEVTLKMMKPAAYLINTSRGAVVDTKSLKKALKENWIKGAAIDVFEEEPIKDMELLSLPNLVPTPHIGGTGLESLLAMGRSAIKHLVVFFGKGKKNAK